MSSEPTLHITRANYEEFFLLYVDNELSADGRAAVEAFAALHPDLQEELELLEDTKLPPDFLPLADKAALLAPGIAAAALEEDLLCYIDNELPEAERLRLEALLRTDAGLQAGHAALLGAKLDPAETIPCPFTSELYREEPARRRAFGWWRVAAAVLLIAGAGRAYLSFTAEEAVTGPGNFAQNSETLPARDSQPALPETVPSAPARATVPYSEGIPAAADQAAAGTATGSNGDATAPSRSGRPRSSSRNGEATVAPDPLTAAGTQQLPTVVETAYTPVSTERVNSLAAPASAQQNINSAPVTDAPAVAYTIQNNASSDASTASLDNGRQGSVRGFLRKATRFIERRTGIKTTNEDDQLLLGAVAINLK